MTAMSTASDAKKSKAMAVVISKKDGFSTTKKSGSAKKKSQKPCIYVSFHIIIFEI